MLDVFTARRQAIAGQVRDLINVRGPRTASQKAALDSLLREADQLEHGIHDETERRRLDAFNSFLRTGAQSDLLTHSRAHLEIRDLGEAGLGTGAASGAGALVPLAWSGVDEAAKLIGPMVDPNVVTIETTDHGNIIDRASDNDTSISATLLAENSQTSMEDIPVLGQQRLGAWKFSSGLVKVSLELLRDSGFDFSSYLARKFGIRMGRGLNPLLSTGTGSSQPLGLVTTILAQGNTVLNATGATLTPDSFSDLEASVDPIYRNANGAGFMLSSTTLQLLRKASDSVGNPLFKMLHSDNVERDYIFGYPAYVNDALSSPQVNPSSPMVTNTVALFGDYKQFRVRRVTPIVYRLQERFAEFGIVAYLMLARYDSALCDGGGGGVKALQITY